MLLAGLAEDGGLYVLKHTRNYQRRFKKIQSMEYVDVAFEVIKPYVETCIPDNDLKQLLKDTYAGFTHDIKAPVVKITDDVYVVNYSMDQRLHLKILPCNYWVDCLIMYYQSAGKLLSLGNLWRYGFGGD